MFIYYVYAYINRVTGLPYYIGKGKGRRAYVGHGRISVPRDKSRIIFLEKNLSDVGSLAIERRYIRWYGRKDNNTGCLLNLTDGGEGSSGVVPSEESNSKRSKALYGKCLSESHKQNLRKPKTEQHKSNISRGRSGIQFSDQHKQNLKLRNCTNRHINNGIQSKFVPAQEAETYILSGWVYGRLKLQIKRSII
jgi:hypothetical protein